MAKIKTNKVIIVPIKMNQLAVEARRESGRLWSDIVKCHKIIRRASFVLGDIKWPKVGDFEKQFKNIYSLHSQTVQALIQKFFSNIDTALTNRKNGDTKARLPYKSKKYFNPIFKGQSIKQFGNRIRLPLKNKNYLWYTIPEIAGKIVQAELGFNKLFVTVQNEIDVPEKATEKIASLDFGIIHTAVITDGINSLGVVGRGIRSIKQGHAKTLAEISRKISKTKKGSMRRKFLLKTKYKIINRKENLLRNALHHVSRIIVNFCVENNISLLVIGELENINKNMKRKRRRQCNQEIGQMEFGTLFKYLEYKLKEKGIEIKKISEAYTSKTCPRCGYINKPSGRRYKCKDCNYIGIRDLIGAYNIRNLYINDEIRHDFSIPPKSLKYLRPIQMVSVGRSSKPVAPAKVA